MTTAAAAKTTPSVAPFATFYAWRVMTCGKPKVSVKVAYGRNLTALSDEEACGYQSPSTRAIYWAPRFRRGDCRSSPLMFRTTCLSSEPNDSHFSAFRALAVDNVITVIRMYRIKVGQWTGRTRILKDNVDFLHSSVAEVFDRSLLSRLYPAQFKGVFLLRFGDK